MSAADQWARDEVQRRMKRIIRDKNDSPLNFIGYADGPDMRALYAGWGALERERQQCGMVDYSDHAEFWQGWVKGGVWNLPIKKYRE